MKIPKEPVSAFAIYSEKLRQKKKHKKPLVSNVVSTIKKKPAKMNDLNILQVKEITDIMQALAKQTSSPYTTIKPKENTTSQAEKLKRKIDKKFQNENIQTNTSNKKKNVFQADKVQLLKKEIEVSLVNDDIKKKKLKPIKGVMSEQKTEILKTDPSNKIIKTKHVIQDKKLVIEENKNKMFENEKKKTIKEKNKSDKIIKLKKKKEKLTKSDWTNQENSAYSAKHLFEWLILPISEKDFMGAYWEKRPLLIQREGNGTYFSELISTLEIDSMIRKNNVQFTKHLDVTSYTDQKRETHNLSGRAHANVVWDFYTNGCSLRLLNPQVFLPKIHTLNATLQGYFGCFVGANVYLTPPNSQGFAPHYDDIEAFVLQIEGKKHWKVYPPRNSGEFLPRYSSPNFSQEEIGDPILDVTLKPGDMLYFPRGYIHQASTVEGEHSLHITLSAYQKTAWVDLLEKAIPIALERAAVEDVEFRKGLPRDYLGIEFHGSDAAKESFMNTAQRLMSKVADVLQFSLGAGVDKMGAQFMHDALPPVFTPEEKKNMVLGSGLKMKEKGKLVGRVEFEMTTEIKLARENICRQVEEEGELRLYHCLDNPLEYHADDPQFLVLPPEGGPVINHLSVQYPAFVPIQNLPHTDKDALLTLLSDLWDAGLLIFKEIPTVDEDNKLSI